MQVPGSINKSTQTDFFYIRVHVCIEGPVDEENTYLPLLSPISFLKLEIIISVELVFFVSFNACLTHLCKI